MQTKQYEIGTYTMGSTAGFNADADFDVDLSRMPEYLTPGMVAIVTGFELKVAGTFGTLASNPALFSFLLRSQLDLDLIGPAGFRMAHMHGWHEPIWSILQNGRVYGTRCADLPATGGGGPGSYARTFTMHLDLYEPYLASKFARCIPSIALAKGQGVLRVHCYSAGRAIKGVTLSTTGLVLTVTANLVEFPANMVPLPIMMETSSVEKIKDTQPSPDVGAYLRLGLANDPRFATTADDVSAYTTVNLFGDSGNYTTQNKKVDQLLREFNEEISTDPHLPFVPAAAPTTASPTVKSETRLLDPLENVDGLTRWIPLVTPKRGSDVAFVPSWFGKKPAAQLNNDITTGLPASVDILYQRIMPRTDAWVTAIVGAMGQAAMGRQLIVPPGYVDPNTKALKRGVDRNRIPLIIDARR